MKAWKSISLFWGIPVLLLVGGFLGGVWWAQSGLGVQKDNAQKQSEAVKEGNLSMGEHSFQEIEGYVDWKGDGAAISPPEESQEGPLFQASAEKSTLNADTEYVLEEMDLRNHTIVETVWKLPPKYIGMNRETFLVAMENYQAAPPLSELEKGFVSLEVLSFSTERVVIQMSYDYKEPNAGYYLKVENNYVVVYMDDAQTLYMNTDILVTSLPDSVQQQIIHVMFMPDEASLFAFLETYSG